MILVLWFCSSFSLSSIYYSSFLSKKPGRADLRVLLDYLLYEAPTLRPFYAILSGENLLCVFLLEEVDSLAWLWPWKLFLLALLLMSRLV